MTSEAVTARLEAVKVLHAKFEELKNAHEREVAKLDDAFMQRCQPLFVERKGVIEGLTDPAPAAASGKDQKGIPQFWLTAIKNHDQLRQLVEPKDEECLQSLIDVSRSKDADECKVTFTFGPNEYFTNTELSKTFVIKDGVVEDIKGCDIAWKDGKDLTHATVAKTTKKGKKITRKVREESFFNFFADPPADVAAAVGEIEQQELALDLEAQVSIAKLFSDELVPGALMFYLGSGDDDSELEEDSGIDDLPEEEDDDEDDAEGGEVAAEKPQKKAKTAEDCKTQ